MLGPKAFTPPGERPERAIFDAHRGRPAILPHERQVAQHIIETLIVEPQPEILDLLTGEETLVPESMEPSRLVGLGPSEDALSRNPRLTERVVHQVNQEDRLPFDGESFDAVISSFVIPYVQDAAGLFDEVARVLKPGGLLMVLWGERFDDDLAIRYWKAADDDERMLLVEETISQSGEFESPRIFIHPAPLGFEDSGEIALVYAERKGADPQRPGRPFPTVLHDEKFSPEEVEERKRHVAETGECPYCSGELTRVPVEPSPWGGWDARELYVCMNDECPRLLQSYATLYEQGIRQYIYRATFLPETGQMVSLPTPVQGEQVLPRRLTKDH
jgi:SAM-dependent methyltransferase